ncbi:MAG: sigma-54 dependent transcriptional regulator [Thermodesulfobacteriota bacterium]
MKPTILAVDDERAICIAIQRLLASSGYEADTAGSREEAIEKLGRNVYHLVITDLNMKRPDDGMELLRWVKQSTPDTAVIMITAYGDERKAVEAMKLGASDYVPKPFDNDELLTKVQRELERIVERRETRMLREQIAGTYRFESLVGKSPAMQRVFDVIRRVADSDLTVLVRGPSGTGKELVANAIHYNSPRRAKPLVKVNCAAFTRELVESELFGHEKGAFTGATSTREGKFEIADGGTLFLDEIGDMALETQAKILRVLQEKELERVGGNRTIKVDVRVIAATNQDLEAKTRDGSFREDLFYRLNVVPIVLPSLREREGDLPLLIEHFLDKAAGRLKRPAKTLSAAAMRAMLAYEWKGNVRELEHAIEQAVVLASADEIELDDLPAVLRGAAPPAAPLDGARLRPAGELDGEALADGPTSFKEAKQRIVEQFERQFIEEALTRHAGNISKAAEEIGMYRQQLQDKLKDLGIDAAAFKARGR